MARPAPGAGGTAKFDEALYSPLADDLDQEGLNLVSTAVARWLDQADESGKALVLEALQRMRTLESIGETVLGNLDQAVACFEDALTFCGKAGYRPELAWTCCDYADTLFQRNEPGDREKAKSLLDESLAF